MEDRMRDLAERFAGYAIRTDLPVEKLESCTILQKADEYDPVPYLTHPSHEVMHITYPTDAREERSPKQTWGTGRREERSPKFPSSSRPAPHGPVSPPTGLPVHLPTADTDPKYALENVYIRTGVHGVQARTPARGTKRKQISIPAHPRTADTVPKYTLKKVYIRKLAGGYEQVDDDAMIVYTCYGCEGCFGELDRDDGLFYMCWKPGDDGSLCPTCSLAFMNYLTDEAVNRALQDAASARSRNDEFEAVSEV